MKLRTAPVFVASFVALITVLAQAQQPAAPGAGPGKDKAKAKAARGIKWPSPPLPDSPYKFDTGLERNLTLTITKGLTTPFSMVFPDSNTILITERGGKLRIVRNGVLNPEPVPGLPPIQATGLTGLMDMALHPNFAQNSLIYICYSKPAGDDGKVYGLTLARFRWDGAAINNWQDLYSTGVSGGGGGSRIVFGRDGMVYMNVSAAGDPPAPASMDAQDVGSLRGKVLRLRDDGTIPPDNPFVNRPDAKPEIFTIGHRNILGLDVNPVTGEIWSCENGPNGGDEVNILVAGKNYGWPVVNHGRIYSGPRVAVDPYKEGMEPPVIYWVPAIAVSGLHFYTGDHYPNWTNHLFIGGMREGEVPRSGHLERIDFNDDWEELHREGILRELRNRIRDIRQGPDGLLYLLTDEANGALLRIDPAN